MTAHFITATGTEVGKTFVTCLLIEQLLVQQKKACAIKPIISGYEAAASDTRSIAEALGLPWNEATADQLSPWRFAAPLSPHLAAEQEGRKVDAEALLRFCHSSITEAGDAPLLIEGAGGVMTPISRSLLTADWIAALGIPAILVAGSYLGSLSHSLAAYESLVKRGIPVAGVVVSESEASNTSLYDTVASLRCFLSASLPIIALPRVAGDGTMGADIPDLTRLLHG